MALKVTKMEPRDIGKILKIEPQCERAPHVLNRISMPFRKHPISTQCMQDGPLQLGFSTALQIGKSQLPLQPFQTCVFQKLFLELISESELTLQMSTNHFAVHFFGNRKAVVSLENRMWKSEKGGRCRKTFDRSCVHCRKQ